MKSKLKLKSGLVKHRQQFICFLTASNVVYRGPKTDFVVVVVVVVVLVVLLCRQC